MLSKHTDLRSKPLTFPFQLSLTLKSYPLDYIDNNFCIPLNKAWNLFKYGAGVTYLNYNVD